ncbi:MAG TPA: hypothetical protein PKH77_18555 [Anaerolineae bacterium]|nr:hypothetical protein [Anaerolineae bacterium]
MDVHIHPLAALQDSACPDTPTRIVTVRGIGIGLKDNRRERKWWSRALTGLEIQNGEIGLVRWRATPESTSPYQREGLGAPRKLKHFN